MLHNLSSLKIAILISKAGPALKKERLLNNSINYEQRFGVSRGQFFAWKRDGINSIRKKSPLIKFCKNLKHNFGLEITPENIINENLGITEFSKKLGMDEVETANVVAYVKLNNIGEFPLKNLAGNPPSYDSAAKILDDSLTGIYKVERKRNEEDKIPMISMLIIGEKLYDEEKRKQVSYVRLYNPHFNSEKNIEYFEYTGSIICKNDWGYIMLEQRRPKSQDMVYMIVDMPQPIDVLTGKYFSKDMDGNANIGMREVTIIKMSGMLSDIEADKVRKLCRP